MSQPHLVDPRGLRVAATATATVLALVLVTPSPVGVWLLAAQVAIFAVAALVGLRYSPYAIVFARLIRPRIAAPTDLEDARPPRFAQIVGLSFTAIALLALLGGASTVAYIATAFALVAALLNAAVGLCLGCELYLAVRRLAPVNA